MDELADNARIKRSNNRAHRKPRARIFHNNTALIRYFDGTPPLYVVCEHWLKRENIRGT